MPRERQPSKGWRRFKGHGTRLVKQVYDDGTVNDVPNSMTWEGTGGWKRGLIVQRLYVSSSEHGPWYRLDCFRRDPGPRLTLIGSGQASKRGAAWDDLFADLKAKGIMPESAVD